MYAEEEGEVFLGRSQGAQATNVSAETARMIDEEVRRIIDDCYSTAKRLLEENRDKLDAMAQALMKYETIDLEQINDIMAGKPVRDPKGWSDDDRRRSEEHTSELQSRPHLVCRLLLEKKKRDQVRERSARGGR